MSSSCFSKRLKIQSNSERTSICNKDVNASSLKKRCHPNCETSDYLLTKTGYSLKKSLARQPESAKKMSPDQALCRHQNVKKPI
ncbi:hypothetical protein TNIN_33011 [Trichonephila inaurata madagascariensis]|uniref:Uncharacterized protein n=1 Tax=Trichonephila inaurata madagascariensis TaxID=2747483 RepID=A0A8X6Y7M2_9ARAC|nr:hypothetical protein TNIN_33011 [Trichonephila inaurata madagascariensis]